MTDIFEEIPGIIDKVEPAFIESYWPWIAGAVLAAAALLAFLVLRRKRARELSPFELASMRLAAAKGVEDSKAYASALSSLVRDYISAAFGMPAPERTTEEFLRMAQTSGQMDGDEQQKIGEILTLADMAKFAKLDFDAYGRERMFALAQTFIEGDNARRTEAKPK